MSALILASKSTTRMQLLTNAGVAFEACGSGVDEDAEKTLLLGAGATPLHVARALAEAKALAVSSRQPGKVIGADQTLDFEGCLFDKVSSVKAARDRLLMMRGADHVLHTAAVVAQGGTIIWRGEESPRLSMRPFTEVFLDAYMARNGEKVLSSVGCYQLEGEGLQLFDRIDGDYFSILGLPMLPLMRFLRSTGAIAE
jgi:septum formation protein